MFLIRRLLVVTAEAAILLGASAVTKPRVFQRPTVRKTWLPLLSGESVLRVAPSLHSLTTQRRHDRRIQCGPNR